MLLFVYGTLSSNSDHPMARRLRAHAELLGPGAVRGRKVELGSYPGMLEAEGPGQLVHGELYELREAALIAELDRYEGCDEDPPEYIRRSIEVRSADGRAVMAWAYFYAGPLPD